MLSVSTKNFEEPFFFKCLTIRAHRRWVPALDCRHALANPARSNRAVGRIRSTRRERGENGSREGCHQNALYRGADAAYAAFQGN